MTKAFSGVFGPTGIFGIIEHVIGALAEGLAWKCFAVGQLRGARRRDHHQNRQNRGQGCCLCTIV
jgi:hypothetical protein